MVPILLIIQAVSSLFFDYCAEGILLAHFERDLFLSNCWLQLFAAYPLIGKVEQLLHIGLCVVIPAGIEVVLLVKMQVCVCSLCWLFWGQVFCCSSGNNYIYAKVLAVTK